LLVVELIASARADANGKPGLDVTTATSTITGVEQRRNTASLLLEHSAFDSDSLSF
jgi:hypothetical protein